MNKKYIFLILAIALIVQKGYSYPDTTHPTDPTDPHPTDPTNSHSNYYGHCLPEDQDSKSTWSMKNHFEAVCIDNQCASNNINYLHQYIQDSQNGIQISQADTISERIKIELRNSIPQCGEGGLSECISESCFEQKLEIFDNAGQFYHEIIFEQGGNINNQVGYLDAGLTHFCDADPTDTNSVICKLKVVYFFAGINSQSIGTRKFNLKIERITVGDEFIFGHIQLSLDGRESDISQDFSQRFQSRVDNQQPGELVLEGTEFFIGELVTAKLYSPPHLEQRNFDTQNVIIKLESPYSHIDIGPQSVSQEIEPDSQRKYLKIQFRVDMVGSYDLRVQAKLQNEQRLLTEEQDDKDTFTTISRIEIKEKKYQEETKQEEKTNTMVYLIICLALLAVISVSGVIIFKIRSKNLQIKKKYIDAHENDIEI